MKWKNSGYPTATDIQELKANLQRLFGDYSGSVAYQEAIAVLNNPRKRHTLTASSKPKGKKEICSHLMLDRSGARLDEDFENINGALVCSVKLLPGVHKLVAL